MSEKHQRLPVVAITGGIGSGKSTAAAVFKENGAFVLDADSIAKELLWSDKHIQQKVVEEFGTAVCNEDGVVDKTLLAGVVFQNQGAINRLNAIVHPPVIRYIRDIITQHLYSPCYSMIVVDAALVFEAGVETDFDFVVTVSAEDTNRMKRIHNRDNSSQFDIHRRMNVQEPQEEHIKKSDYVLYNSGSLAEFQKKARELSRKGGTIQTLYNKKQGI